MKNKISKIANFLSDGESFKMPLIKSANEVIDDLNKLMFYKSDGRFRTLWSHLVTNSPGQSKQDYTKQLSVFLQQDICSLFGRSFGEEFTAVSDTGYDFEVSGLKIEMKCSNNCEKTNTGKLEFTSFLGNKFQLQKTRADAFLLVSVNTNTVTGYMDSIATVLVNNDDRNKTYYSQACKDVSGHKGSAHLTIKVPGSYNQNSDYWCANCSVKNTRKNENRMTWTHFIHD